MVFGPRSPEIPCFSNPNLPCLRECPLFSTNQASIQDLASRAVGLTPTTIVSLLRNPKREIESLSKALRREEGNEAAETLTTQLWQIYGVITSSRAEAASEYIHHCVQKNKPSSK